MLGADRFGAHLAALTGQRRRAGWSPPGGGPPTAARDAPGRLRSAHTATDTGTATRTSAPSTSRGSGSRCSSGRSQHARPADREVGAAGRAAQGGVTGRAPEQPAQRGPGQGRPALPAPIHKGVQVAADPTADDGWSARPRESPTAASRSSPSSRNGLPGRTDLADLPGSQPRPQRLRRDQRSGRHRGARRPHVDPHDLGCGRLDRSLHSQLQGHRRRGAPVAAAEQPESDHVVVGHFDQFDVTAVAAEIGPDPLQRLLDPSAYVVGMQSMHQQADWTPGRRRRARPASRRQAGHPRAGS